MAEAGVDLLIAEMMLDPLNAALVTEAARETGLPVWNGMSAQVSDDARAHPTSEGEVIPARLPNSRIREHSS